MVLVLLLGWGAEGAELHVPSEYGTIQAAIDAAAFSDTIVVADGVYTGLEPLTADDVAEAIVFSATRPHHANVREMILMPTAQAAAVFAHRGS